ncbi:hypothetical protein FA09DRAFT_329372 [Tilletiopsis washingtonensis]|uniref:Mis12-domain-containing protein n=1 Tax=Tilletiopsis washingtonensis TaxID=58919 RepID=A0A316ZDA6_9BASI|nr:hypothetical protein FA09DRAFT_329372 [Tilletiopsis washingtonensis]PWN98892.1 hypothetical protein FA09DRAFT_329372 [Tilletiopsis washingtonensis]
MTSRKSTRGVPVASGSGSGSGSGGAHPSSSAASSSRPAAAASSDAPSTDPHLHLLTEHLGFNPRTFIDALVYVANENMYILGGGLEDYVKQHLAAREGGGLESEQGVHSILTLLENALDHTFDTLELYCLRYVFGLTHAQARLITLPHHRGLDLRAPDARAEAAREREKERERVRRKARKSRAREEETDMLDESAMKESERLDAKERSLRRRVNAARALKHTLSLASTAAQRRLSRAETLSSTFSSLLHRDSDASGSSTAKLPLVPSSLAVSSRALHLSSSELLSALEDLRAEDALGAPLAKPQNGKAWTGGRDRFVAWEANKLVREHKMGEGGKEAKEKRGAEEKGGARKKRA